MFIFREEKNKSSKDNKMYEFYFLNVSIIWGMFINISVEVPDLSNID